MLLLGFVKRNFVLRIKIFLMTSQLVSVSRFCLKTLPLNTSLFGETVFEKSRVLILVDSKLASAFDGVLFGFEHLR